MVAGKPLCFRAPPPIPPNANGGRAWRVQIALNLTPGGWVAVPLGLASQIVSIQVDQVIIPIFQAKRFE